MKKNIKIYNEFNPFRFLGLTGLLALSISVVIDTVMGINNPIPLFPPYTLLPTLLMLFR